MEGAGKGRFRFSLRRMLLVLTVAVLVLSHALTSYRLYRSDAELAELRRVTGDLVVSDPRKLHVVSLQAVASLTQSNLHDVRWRVYVPRGKKYTITVRLNELASIVPADATSESRTIKHGILEPGEWIVAFRHGISDNEDEVQFDVEAEAVGATRNFGAGWGLMTKRAPWFGLGRHKYYEIAGQDATDSFEVDEPASLMELYSRPLSDTSGNRKQGQPQMSLLLLPRNNGP